MLDNRITFIGTGRMGSALIKSLVNSNRVRPEQIIAFDIDQKKLKELSFDTGVKTALKSREAIEAGEIILLAIKPQNIDEALEQISPYLDKQKLIISIAAGITLEHIYSFLGKDKKVVRVMPNTPAQIGQGISVISPGQNVDEESKQKAKAIFKTAGEVVFLDEEWQAVATAISGSGPAYFFLFAETLIEAAVEQGLTPEVASKLVIETMLGSAGLLKETSQSPKSLREAVSSPGGTTVAAIKIFEEADFQKIVSKAVEAAIKRAYELS